MDRHAANVATALTSVHTMASSSFVYRASLVVERVDNSLPLSVTQRCERLADRHPQRVEFGGRTALEDRALELCHDRIALAAGGAAVFGQTEQQRLLVDRILPA